MVIVGVLEAMIYELLIMNELIIYSYLFPFHFLLVPQDTEGLWHETKHYRFGFFSFFEYLLICIFTNYTQLLIWIFSFFNQLLVCIF